MSERVFVALGANLGDRAHTMAEAMTRLGALPQTEVLAVAPLKEWPALLPSPDAEPQPPYLNTVAELRTALEPRALLTALLELERTLGRVREGRWSARTIDLDLLRYGDRTIDEPGLTVPHPRMLERAFVMEPYRWLLARR